jgi:RES domain-containing protein
MPPKPLEQRIEDALQHVAPFVGVCFRSVLQRFATAREVLSTRGSFIFGGRYNFIGSFSALYLSCDIHTCVEETTKSLQLSEHEVALQLPRTIVGVQVNVSHVLDLTDATVRQRLDVLKRDLLGDWAYDQDVLGVEAFTQRIGRLARETGFEALLVPSVVSRGCNLVVFVDRLLSSSSLKVVNVQNLQP